MEEEEKLNELITESVMHYIENRGVTRKWFYDALGLSQPTFHIRVTKHNWKDSEKLALKHLNIIK